MEFLQRYRNRPKRPPELSVRLRALTFAAQAVTLFAVAWTTAMWLVVFLALIVLAVGHVSAYRSARDGVKLRTRAFAFIGFHVVMAWMCAGLFIGAPYPQVQLSTLGMAIVSWELLNRMNLQSGLGMGIGNLYVAATLSRDVMFGVFLLMFIALLLAFLWVADSEDGLKRNPIILRASVLNDDEATPDRRIPTGWALRAGGAVLVLGMMLFLVVPRYAGRPLIKPLSIRVPIQSGVRAQIVNPAVPLVQIEGMSTGESEYYYGFDSQLDLSYRGGLSDTIMMYVRSPAPSYWRSHAYDFYDGRTWSQSSDDVELVDHDTIFYLRDELDTSDAFVQSFFIAEPMPNLIFTGGDPFQLWIAADEVSVDISGGIRVGEALRPGMIYSVVSTPVEFDADVLRAASRDYPAEIRARYLQLPETVTERTRQMARDLTAGTTNPYDAAVVMRDHLLVAYPYDFYPPPQPPNSDAVDLFLFHDQRGVCEHYVSSMVIMLRTLGIPARLVAGYGSGQFNQFTGYYEVRALDAHAWVEIYFPDHGWVPMDPTPGWVADPVTGPLQRWVFSGAFDGVDFAGLGLPLQSAFAAGAAVIGVVGVPLLAIGMLAVAVYLSRWLWQQAGQAAFLRWRARQSKHPARRKVFAAYRRAQRRLKSPRGAAQTVEEHLSTHEGMMGLTEAVEIAAYRPEPPSEDEIRRAEGRSVGER